MKPLIFATILLLAASFGLVMAFHPPGAPATGAQAALQGPTTPPSQNIDVITSTITVPSASATDAVEQPTKVKFGFDGTRYTPSEIRVKQGTVVRLEGDTSTLRGCMASVTIGGYGISKRIVAGDNVIEFTADKAGTYPITCSMGMGGGKLIVEDDAGSVPANTVAVPASSGGCGCGH